MCIELEQDIIREIAVFNKTRIYLVNEAAKCALI